MADHYRVQIEAENHLTPAEVAALAAAELPGPAHAWVGKLAQMCARIGSPSRPFRHRPIAQNVSLYEGAGPAEAPRGLVVAFTGVAMRMMLPIAPFLQALPADRVDVLVLRDPNRVAFLDGVPGYAASLPALAARLEADLPLARYADRRCVGTSSGGAAALVFGRLVGARVALSLGGAHPRGLVMRTARPELDRFAFEPLMAGAGPSLTRMICAHGEDFPRDSVRSRLLAMTLTRSEVLVVREVATHGVLGGLVQRDALPRFLEEVLLGDAPPAGGAWRP
jgi:hypothetical protein